VVTLTGSAGYERGMGEEGGGCVCAGFHAAVEACWWDACYGSRLLETAGTCGGQTDTGRGRESGPTASRAG